MMTAHRAVGVFLTCLCLQSVRPSESVTVHVDASQTLRIHDRRRLLGVNIRETKPYLAELRKQRLLELVKGLSPGIIRMPGGMSADGMIWTDHREMIRQQHGRVDPLPPVLAAQMGHDQLFRHLRAVHRQATQEPERLFRFNLFHHGKRPAVFLEGALQVDAIANPCVERVLPRRSVALPPVRGSK